MRDTLRLSVKHSPFLVMLSTSIKVMRNIIPMIRYVSFVLRHKYYVFVAGRRTRAPRYQLLVHDLSKFGYAELPHYARAYFGDRSDPAGLASAWLHHQNSNPHHWEYWIPRSTHVKQLQSDDCVALPMPEGYVREMIADWLAAARTYTGVWPTSLETWTWLSEARSTMVFHSKTSRLVDEILAEVFSSEQP